LDDGIYQSFIGGYGLASRILFNLIPKGADPLGPDNVLGLLPGLLTGTSALFSGRYMAVGKSPLTGGWGDANGGGTFGPSIKRAGWDGIFFKGQSEAPVYVIIRNEQVEICDAAEIWGKSTIETEQYLHETLDNKKIKTVSIGPAGEKLSLISGIFNDSGRCAARSGLGAVMGSKKLKAVVVSGNQKVDVHNGAELRQLNKELLSILNDRWIGKLFDWLPGFGKIVRVLGRVIGFVGLQTKLMPPLLKTLLTKYGTSGFMAFYCGTGEAPVKNWKGVAKSDFTPEMALKISDEAVQAIEVKKYHCANCPIGCGGTIQTKDGSHHKPEYETLAAFGSMCLVDDLPAICEANQMCNLAGMDTISAGTAIAFAMECYEKGILSRENLDGIDLKWGDSREMLKLLQKMIARDGIGDKLADGVKKAVEQIGEESEMYAMHVGGQEMGLHDPRVDPGFGLAYQCEPTPGRHTISAYAYQELYDLHKLFPKEKVKSVPQVISKRWKHKEKGKAKRQALNSKYANLISSAGLCKFGALTTGPHFPIFKWLNAATGWNLSNEMYLMAGERIETMRQAFNSREGIAPFKLPDRILGRPALSEGPVKNVELKLSGITKEFYQEFQWDDRTTIPREEALNKLGLEDIASAIKK